MRSFNLVLFGIVVLTFSCRPSDTKNQGSADTLINHIAMAKDTFLTTDTIIGFVYYYDRYLETKSINEGKSGKPEFSVTYKKSGERYSGWFKNSVLIGNYKDYRLTNEKLIENSIQIRNDTGLIRFALPDTVRQRFLELDLEVSAMYPIALGDTGWVARTRFYILKK